ncbi:MAG: tyrosine-protein phosphatase [Clostridia bacterium]|nr:tyrosine-protein phosphatase [Clostridia bacterium]
MGSLLKSTCNTRALPTGTLRYIRSDAPVSLTEEEIAWLRENDITTMVDLRSDEEVQHKPCALQGKAGFRYVHLPVTGGGGTPISREHLHQVYRGMLDEQMERILDVIMNADTNVMYFCSAGKDRTGVVSALILRKLGFSEDEIVADYMLTKDNVMGSLQAYVALHPEVDMEIIVPQEENIRKLLAQL